MQSQRSSSLIGTFLSLLGCALVICGVFFLPMSFGNGASNADVPNFELNFYFDSSWGAIWVTFAVLLTLPLLSMLFVLGTSAVSFFRELSPGMVTWRGIAAITGLIIQGLVGFAVATFMSFSLSLGAGYWLPLLGFVVMSVGIFLYTPRSMWR
jgi:hypothetical protein